MLNLIKAMAQNPGPHSIHIEDSLIPVEVDWGSYQIDGDEVEYIRVREDRVANHSLFSEGDYLSLYYGSWIARDRNHWYLVPLEDLASRYEVEKTKDDHT